VSEAARENNITHMSIAICAKGITELARGYCWKRGDDNAKLYH